MFSRRQDKKLEQSKVGQIGTKGLISFSLDLSKSGKLTLTLNGNIMNADFVPIENGKAMVFCSTGEFSFSNLKFMATSIPGNVTVQ